MAKTVECSKCGSMFDPRGYISHTVRCGESKDTPSTSSDPVSDDVLEPSADRPDPPRSPTAAGSGGFWAEVDELVDELFG
jgi:hypothetical protein